MKKLLMLFVLLSVVSGDVAAMECGDNSGRKRKRTTSEEDDREGKKRKLDETDVEMTDVDGEFDWENATSLQRQYYIEKLTGEWYRSPEDLQQAYYRLMGGPIKYLPGEMLLEVLKRLDVQDLVGGGVPGVCKQWNNLAPGLVEDLNLSKRRDLSSDDIVEIVTRYKNLTSLDLSFTQITDAGLQAILAVCKKLQELDLTDTFLTDAGLQAIVAGCPGLRMLGLSGMQITDAGLQAIIAGCSGLQGLNLYRTQITDVGLQAIFVGCPNLELVIKPNGARMTKDEIEVLRNEMDVEEIE